MSGFRRGYENRRCDPRAPPAYVLMTNHFHLVVQTPEPDLSRGMHWLNGTYAARFNHRHRRAGHLFRRRFHAFLVEKESYFAELLRYVVLDPVRAKMVARPGQYKRSWGQVGSELRSSVVGRNHGYRWTSS
jgi:hypothetical protein